MTIAVGERSSPDLPPSGATFGHSAEEQAATAAVLASLSPVWLSLHAVRWPRFSDATIDHITVGPGGVFVVSSRSWAGRASLAAGLLKAPGLPRASCAEAAATAARQIASIVPAYVKLHTWAAVCFTRDEPLAGRLGDTFVCSTQTLPSMLGGREVVLSPVEVRHVYQHLSDALTGGFSAAV